MYNLDTAVQLQSVQHILRKCIRFFDDNQLWYHFCCIPYECGFPSAIFKPYTPHSECAMLQCFPLRPRSGSSSLWTSPTSLTGRSQLLHAIQNLSSPIIVCQPFNPNSWPLWHIFSMFWQVESDHNYDIIVEFLAGFAHDIPTAADMKDHLLTLNSKVIYKSCISRRQCWFLPTSVISSFQEALAWCSAHYQLNPYTSPKLHEASQHHIL